MGKRGKNHTFSVEGPSTYVISESVGGEFGEIVFCLGRLAELASLFDHTHKILMKDMTNPFSRRFREELSFPNSVERSILKLPLSKLCAVPFALQSRSTFRWGAKGETAPRKGEEEGLQRGKKEKKTRENRSDEVFTCIVSGHPRAKAGTGSIKPLWHKSDV